MVSQQPNGNFPGTESPLNTHQPYRCSPKPINPKGETDIDQPAPQKPKPESCTAKPFTSSLPRAHRPDRGSAPGSAQGGPLAGRERQAREPTDRRWSFDCPLTPTQKWGTARHILILFVFNFKCNWTLKKSTPQLNLDHERLAPVLPRELPKSRG